MQYIIISTPTELPAAEEGELSSIVFKVLLRQQAVVKVTEVIAPITAAADPGQYVTDNFAALFAAAIETNIGAWIAAENFPFVDYYYAILVAGYLAIQANGTLNEAMGAALLEIQKDSTKLSQYDKLRTAIQNAPIEDQIRFMTQWNFAMTGIISVART